MKARVGDDISACFSSGQNMISSSLLSLRTPSALDEELFGICRHSMLSALALVFKKCIYIYIYCPVKRVCTCVRTSLVVSLFFFFPRMPCLLRQVQHGRFRRKIKIPMVMMMLF